MSNLTPFSGELATLRPSCGPSANRGLRPLPVNGWGMDRLPCGMRGLRLLAPVRSQTIFKFSQVARSFKIPRG